MRKYFEQQLELGAVPISEVKLNPKSRDGLVAVLKGLQYIFNTPSIQADLFSVLEKKVLGGKKRTGRQGMSLWEIFVLGVARLEWNADYDHLHDLANNHRALRGILGIAQSDFSLGKQYELQTLKDNVRLLDEQTIYELNELVVQASHGMIKKKEGVPSLDLQIKADSFVVESKISFPTDLRLLFTSIRKGIESIGYFQKNWCSLLGWRNWKQHRNEVRKMYRFVSEIHRRKGANYKERLQAATKPYLKLATKLLNKLNGGYEALKQEQSCQWDGIAQNKKEELLYYIECIEKHIDLVDRRILKGEIIAAKEKVYSIFEPHVEWNSKGKAGKAVELGHNTLIATDQYNLILYAKVYEKEVDKQQVIPLGNSLEDKYGQTEHLKSISFDKNFYSKPNEDLLRKHFELVFLPKPGRKSVYQREQEHTWEYQQVKKGHTLIESNINELEQHGLDICPDKKIEGFKRYVAYGVVSYNLAQLGKRLLLEQRATAKAALKAAKKRRNRLAA